jgi:hypothetical protein
MKGAILPLTIFAMPKAFRGHFAIIQRNAIISWTRLRPKAEVILMGNDPGTPEIARELGLRHIGDVASNKSGAPRLDDLFAKAEAAVSEGLLCYVNADIMLMDDFTHAVQRVAGLSPLLMIGRRWDTNIATPWDFAPADWQERLRAFAHAQGERRGAAFVDYFLFSRGLGRNLLPLALGRTLWDNWLILNARKHGATIVDASDVVTAVHQNHDYSHHPQGTKGVWSGEEAKENRRLIGDSHRLLTLDDVTHRLTADAVKPCYGHLWRAVRHSWRQPRVFAKGLVRSLTERLGS